MISLTCTSCKTVLEIDDAFAGGVCRCQHCGTIQTVPAKQRAAAPAGAKPAAAPKALYQKTKPTGAETTASIAAALVPPPPRTRAARPGAPASAKRVFTFILAGALAVAIAVVIIWLMSRPAA